jgi:DNA uptake protein ComE-like DNA-binding protein
MNSTQLLYAMALQAVPNIGDITAKKLIQHWHSGGRFQSQQTEP